MTKRSAEAAIVDELEAERALYKRLEEQELRREESVRTAADLLHATRTAMRESQERETALTNALDAVRFRAASTANVVPADVPEEIEVELP